MEDGRSRALLDVAGLDQRLADAALIAGRIAHDFDNILTGIVGFTDLTVPLLPPGTTPAKYVAEIGKVSQRGIEFTTQLHQLSRSGQCRPQPGSVMQAVTLEVARLWKLHPNAAKFAMEIPNAFPAVRMHTDCLTIVMGHLLANAIEATPPEGTIRVTARELDATPTEAAAYSGMISPGHWVEILVQDTGAGVKPEMREKLFAAPFVTNKPRHRGIGLAVVYRVLRAHGGGVRVESEVGRGTVAAIVVPVADSPEIGGPHGR